MKQPRGQEDSAGTPRIAPLERVHQPRVLIEGDVEDACELVPGDVELNGCRDVRQHLRLEHHRDSGIGGHEHGVDLRRSLKPLA
jgi:hypothetical protein